MQNGGSYALGIFYAVMFGLSLGGLFIVQKLTTDKVGMNAIHMILIRQFVGLLLSYVYAKTQGLNLSWMGYYILCDFTKESRRLVMWRTLIDWTAGLLVTFAILYMPVSQSISISRITVFAVPILAFVLIDETISCLEILTIVGGFTGIIMIMNPTYFNSSSQSEIIGKRNSLDSAGYPHLYVGCFLSVLFALVAAMSIILVRIQNKMGGQQTAPVPISLQVYFFGMATSLFMVFVAMFMAPEMFALQNIQKQKYCMSSAQLAWYAAMGLLYWNCCVFAPLALQTIKSNTFSPFTNLAIVISFLFDIFYFNRIMLFSDYLGTTLIIACTICLTLLAKE